MRVGLSLLTLVPGVVGGSETYARGLCRALTEGKLDAVAFVPTLAPDAGEGLPTEIVTEYPAATSTAGRLRAMASGALSRPAMRRRFAGLDSVHYPLTVAVPRLDLPSVVTLHDVQHLDLPELFSRGERAYRRLAYDRGARRAEAVVVPSAFVRDRATAVLGLEPARVAVIPHGVNHEVHHPDPAVEREPLLLYPAKTWPHKNHVRLLEALGPIRAERPGLRLVLTGDGTGAYAGIDGVDARGLVGRDELVGLYRRAACLVFPSLYEGFGAPPLEAMACGTPVAASSAGSLPEVCGDAAVLFDPVDPSAIAAGVLEALERSEELSRLGRDRAASFTWAAAADAHEAVYRATAAR